jgi:hypothetical protein
MPSPVSSAQELVKRKSVWWTGLLPVAALLYLYTTLFSVAGTPLFRAGDDSFFRTYAWRMLNGEVFLRDFHQFTPPGTDLVYLAAYRWGGAGVGSSNWVGLGVGFLLALVWYGLARALMPAGRAALAALICLVFLYGDRLDVTHHWFSVLAGSTAVLVLLRVRSVARVALAGALIGLAAFCTQTTGAVTLLACCGFLVWEGRRADGKERTAWVPVGVLAGTAAAVWLVLTWRFIAAAGWSRWWFAQVLYLPRASYFPKGFLVPWFVRPNQLGDWIKAAQRGFIYVLFVAVCPWVLWWLRRRGIRTPDEARAVLVALWGSGLMLATITMLNWNRMDPAAAPALILLVWGIGRSGRPERWLTAACWCCAGAMMMLQMTETERHRFVNLQLPAGRALFEPKDAAEVQWLVEHTRPGDAFFETAMTRFYVPLALRNPAAVDVLSTGRSTVPAWVEETTNSLERSGVRYILWAPSAGIGKVEDTAAQSEDVLQPMREYVRMRFTRVAVFQGGDEIWERTGR